MKGFYLNEDPESVAQDIEIDSTSKSRIHFVTSARRHRGEDKAILQKRHELYEQAKQTRPERWSGSTRNWAPVGAINLNPERADMPLKKAA